LKNDFGMSEARFRKERHTRRYPEARVGASRIRLPLLAGSTTVTGSSGQYDRNDNLIQNFSAGRLLRQDEIIRDPNTGDVSLQLAARHYYGADDRLMAVQRYSYRSAGFRDGTWEEYWYDALGRRVLTRARREPTTTYDATVSGPLCVSSTVPVCRSFTERVWWDGDQSLVEKRTAEGTSDASNSGLLGNIHALTLDEPLAVVTPGTSETRIINYNWRGQGMSSVYPNGHAGDYSTGNAVAEIDWPAATQAQTYFTPSLDATTDNNAKKWLGTFVANGQGTTGMLYRRNRYFDPNTGRFTQEDPIGIAGGLNAYGFANGDPVNFSDPFGLCPEWFDHEPCDISFTGVTLSASWLTANYSASAGEYGGQGETGIYVSKAVGAGMGTLPGKSKLSWLPSISATIDHGKAQSLSALQGPGEQIHVLAGSGWAVGGTRGWNSSGGSYSMSVGYGAGVSFGGQGTNTWFYWRRKTKETKPEVRAQTDATAVKPVR
jgi:RHS repeat-associated protein